MIQKIHMPSLSIPCIRYLFALICMIHFGTAPAKNTFQLEKLDSHEIIVHSIINDTEVGRVTIKKIPLFNFYILHTLYVLPEHRNQGIGKKLLAYACNYAKTQGATRIYIQPGPFELYNKRHLVKPTEGYEERIQKLISLYQKCGFTAASKPLRYCAYVLYKCMDIKENAQHLMVKVF